MGIMKFIYFMCGQLGIMLLARFFFQWLIDFYSQGLPGINGGALLSVTLVGAVLLGFRIFDGVTDPIAGTLSDSWVKRGRQRRSLLWFTAPLPALGLILCFLPNAGHSPEVRWVILVLGLLLFFVGYTLYAIPYWSLIGDYAQGDEKRRSRLSTLLGLGLLIATAIGFVITPNLIDRYSYLNSAFLIALLSIPLMIAPYFAMPHSDTEDRFEHLNEGTTHTESLETQLKNLIMVLKHRRFISVICLFAGSQMSFTIMTAAAPFIASDLLGGQKSDVALILGPLLAVAIPCSALIPTLGRKLGWEKAVAWSCLALACVYLGVGGLGVDLIGSPLMTASILFALGGPMIAVLLGLEGEAISACAQEQESGIGIYFGVYNLIVKGANGLAIGLTAVLAEQARAGDPWQVKLMGISAGGTLFLGLLAYLIFKPRSAVSKVLDH